MSVRLCRWGNSTGLRLPKSVLEMAGLAAGSHVSLRVLDNGDIRVRPMNGCVPAESFTSTVGAAPIEGGDDSWGEVW